MHELHQIGAEDFVSMFDLSPDQLPGFFMDRLAETNTTWRGPTQAELEDYILDLLERINEEFAPRTADENLAAFEKGWRENLERALETGLTPAALKPRYFRKTKYLRYDNTLIVSDNLDLEYDLFVLARIVIFWTYLKEFPTICEFGCGSCANLLMLSEMFPEKQLVGLDWAQASVDIANILAQQGGLQVRGERFDLLDSEASLSLEPGSAILTVHALEQLGERFQTWLDLLMGSKAGIVVNYEPVLEFYDPANLWDYLALLYSRKRGYLSGYLTALRQLADEDRIELLVARRPYLGGVVHEASLVVWRPL